MPGKSGRGQVHAILAEIFQLPANGNKHVRINTLAGQVREKMNEILAATKRSLQNGLCKSERPLS